jgi:hypothetical protein
MISRLHWMLGVLVLFGIAPGCVLPEHASVMKARSAYDECVLEHSETDRHCQVLWETYQSEIKRYEDASRRAWACDPAQEECPTKR